jgi:hypothetical protein
MKAITSHCLIPVEQNANFGPCGAVVGLFTWLRNRPDRPVWHNDSARFPEKSANNDQEHLASADSPSYFISSVESNDLLSDITFERGVITPGA